MRIHLLLLALLCGCPSAPQRDVIPESHDVVGKRGDEGYVYVARRSLATIALAEARGMEAEDAKHAIDRLADSLDACAKQQSERGHLSPGAARIVADVDGGGIVGRPRVVMSPGGEANALLCLVAPFRMTQFSATSSDAGARGIAIEATWGGS